MTATMPPTLKTDEDLDAPSAKAVATVKRGARREDAKPADPRTDPAPEVGAPHTNVSVGKIVLWQQPGGDWWPAIVRRVNGDGTLRLTVFTDNPAPHVGAMCARHVSETSPITQARAAYGVWDFAKE